MTKDLETRITDLEVRMSTLEKGLCTSSSSSREKKRSLSLKEFFRTTGVTSKTSTVKTVLAVAVYSERFRGADFFSASGLNDLIREAKQPRPKNINDCIYKNIQMGYIAEDKRGEDGKKRWYVTNLGIELVDNNFNRDEQNS